MILATLRVMLLSVVRDRGALAMAFILPPAIFVIFAAIFAGASGDELRLRVAYGTTLSSPSADRFEAALRAETSMRISAGRLGTEDAVRGAVKSGAADVGLIVRGDLTELGSSPFLVIVDPGKLMAGPIIAGQVQRIIGAKLTDVGIARTAPTIESLVGGFTPEQKARLDAAIAQIATEAPEEIGGLVATETLGVGGGTSATVTYYAGAVAILFLLFSAMQGAATLIDERFSGIIDRLAVGPAGTDVIVLGKFVFLTAQGCLQVALILAVAGGFYEVDVIAALPSLAVVTLLSASAAAGLGMVVAAIATTKQQAQTASTFIVLVCSAIGGSMVPRFMMPPWLQDIGWYTPNAWAVEAYQGALWRNLPLTELLPSLLPLAATAMVGLLAALLISRSRLKL